MTDHLLFYPSLFVKDHIAYNDEFDIRKKYRPYAETEESEILIYKSNCADFSFVFRDKELDFITKHAPEIMKTTEEEIFELAQKNLVKFYKMNSEFTQMSEGLFLIKGGLFVNSFILLNEFWKRMHKELGKSIVFAMPAYGMLLCFKESDRKAFGAIKKSTLDLMTNSEGEEWSILTRELYLKRKGHSKIYRLGKLY